MADIEIKTTEELHKLGVEFSKWKDELAWSQIVGTLSDNKEVSAKAYLELSKIFKTEGKERIENDFSEKIKLQSSLASQQGKKASELYFHGDDAIGKGLSIIESDLSEVVDKYLGIKARAKGRILIEPSDIKAQIVDINTNISWQEAKDNAASTFSQLGLEDVARDIINARSGGRGQEFWSGFSKIENIPGLDGQRLAAHELGHAVHFELAGEKTNNPELTEIISTFQEALFFKKNMHKAKNPKQKIALLTNQLDNDVTTLEQVGKLDFEKKSYEFAENNPDKKIPMVKIWRESSDSIFGNKINKSGDNADIMDARLMMWDQFMHNTGYGVGYIIGWAAAPKLMEKLEQDPEKFKEKYKDLLKKGSSISADDFLKAFGINMEEKSFWQDRLVKMNIDIEHLQNNLDKIKQGKNSLLPEGVAAKEGKFCEMVAVSVVAPQMYKPR